MTGHETTRTPAPSSRERRCTSVPLFALSIGASAIAAGAAAGCLSASFGPPPDGGADSGGATDAGNPLVPPDGGAATDAAAPPDDAGPGWGFVACGGMQNCEVPFEACEICDPADTVKGTCVPGEWLTCETWGYYPPVLMHCDGDEDCAGEETCRIQEGSLGTYVQCMPLDWCAECTCGGTEVCETLADCPPCATVCEPYQPGHATSVCRT